MRTIYFSEDIDNYISTRMNIEDRTRSATIERLVRKCIDMEMKKDFDIAMAAKSEPDQS